jgi:membrane protease YdiL (CAAX protease family)
MRYHPHQSFVEPALEKSETWRTALGFLIASAVYIVATILFIAALYGFGGDGLADAFFFGETPVGVLLNLVAIGLMIPAVLIPLKALHNRGFWSLIGPLPHTITCFLRVCFAMVLLSLLGLLFPSEEVQSGFSFGHWLILLPLSLSLLLLQVSAEELVFRGYLQQQLAARFASPLVWLIIPSAIFGALHYSAEEFGGNAVWIVCATGLFGLAAADLTARTGNIGAAVALHFMNNFMALLIASPEGTLSGLALYNYPFSFADETAVRALLPVEFMFLFVSWLAARVALRV